jgi:hypothetical protein
MEWARTETCVEVCVIGSTVSLNIKEKDGYKEIT